MTWKVSIRTIKQYLYIYLLIFFSGSSLAGYFLDTKPKILLYLEAIIIFIAFFNILLRKKQSDYRYAYGISAILILSVFVVRFTSGGAGINIICEYLSHIFLAYLAINVDRKNFIHRFVCFVSVIAGVSLIFYFIQLISPGVIQKLFPVYNTSFGYNDWSSGMVIHRSYQAWGKLFFTMRSNEMQRNLGLFSEPANYCIVLSSALVFLLFFPNECGFNHKTYNRIMIIISVVIITSRSTSGYLCLIMLFWAYLMNNNKQIISKTRKRVINIALVGLFVLLIDYYIRGEGSLFKVTVLNKLMADGKFDLSSSTGYWRMGTIATSIGLMASNPLGIGFDAVNYFVQRSLTGAAGGAILWFGASLGVLPFFATIAWYIVPILKHKDFRVPMKIALLFVLFDIEFAQTKVFYPTIVCIIVIICLLSKETQVINSFRVLKGNSYD